MIQEVKVDAPRDREKKVLVHFLGCNGFFWETQHERLRKIFLHNRERGQYDSFTTIMNLSRRIAINIVTDHRENNLG